MFDLSYIHHLSDLHCTPIRSASITSILQTKKLRLRGVKSLANSHTLGVMWSQDLNPVLLLVDNNILIQRINESWVLSPF